MSEYRIKEFVYAGLIAACSLSGCESPKARMVREGIGLPEWYHDTETFYLHPHRERERSVIDGIIWQGRHWPGDYDILSKKEGEKLLQLYGWRNINKRKKDQF